MRRSRKKVRKKNGLNKIFVIIITIILLIILPVTIGYYGTKYFIIPKFFSQENEVSEYSQSENQEQEPMKETENKQIVEDNNPSEQEDVQSEEDYYFEIPGISIYSVQVGSFNNLNHAQNMIDELKGKGLDGYIIKTDRYKVLTRTFFDKENAEKYKNYVSELYNDAFILSINMASKSVSYGEENKYYGESVEKDIKKINNILTEFYTFLTNRDFEKEKVLDFINKEIEQLNELEVKNTNYTPSGDLESINQNLLNMTKAINSKLKELKNSTSITEDQIWNIFNEGVIKYINIF